MIKPITPGDPRKDAAAQNAQEGVISVVDLSILTGIAVSQLTKFAKKEFLEHYGEYHGKRFFNFQKIVSWVLSPGEDNEAKSTIREGMKKEMLASNCPYSIEQVPATSDVGQQTKICWKVPSIY